MLRMFLLQAWFNLPGEGVEDAIYDSYAVRTFMGIDFGHEQAPGATTLCKFRKLLAENNIGEKFFKAINRALEERGHIMRGGAIVGAAIIEAPSSTKNRAKGRGPEMRQAKKGNQWHFGMKAHAGVGAGTGYAHGVTATAANAHDITEAHKLIRGGDEVVYGGAGYTGLESREEIKPGPQKSRIECRTNKRPGKARKMPEGFAGDFERRREGRKSSARGKVEYALLLIKRTFGYRKAAYRGIAKNLHRLHVLFCSANLLMCARSGGWRPA